jgi:hypothetical protein
VDEDTWILHINSDGWLNSNKFVVIESVEPCDVVDPYVGIVWVLLIPVVLAWEAVVMWVESLDDPPLAFDCVNCG